MTPATANETATPTVQPQTPTDADVEDAATETTPVFQDVQSNVLPHSKLMIVFPVLALAQFTAYLDQTSISAAVPAIGHDLALGPSLSWVASSYLLATTSVQLINGRLSDIFGRKQLLLCALMVLAAGNLAGGFAQNAGMLFVFRALSGLGGGAITALVQIIISDITTLQQRGKYNGFIGVAVACGSGFGPLLGGTMTSRISWRWALWYDVPWLVALVALLWYVLPPSKVGGKLSTRLRLVDWAGLAISIAAVVLLMIPLSKGGSTFAWNSSIVISMLTVGAVALVLFVAVEWKFAALPIMPLHLYRSDYSCNIVLAQNFVYGIVFWGNLFYVPVYLETVRGYSAIAAGAIMLPMVATQGVGSILSGLIITKTGHYNPVMIASQFLWAAGAAAQAFYSATTPVWVICIVGFVQGLGTGGCFQPSLVALLSHSRRADRAVLSSLRNFLRTAGGTVGLTMAGAVLNNVLKARLSSVLPAEAIEQAASAAYGLENMGLTPEQVEIVLGAYMQGIRIVFVVYAPLLAACAVAACLVRDEGLSEKDAPSVSSALAAASSSSSSSVGVNHTTNEAIAMTAAAVVVVVEKQNQATVSPQPSLLPSATPSRV